MVHPAGLEPAQAVRPQIKSLLLCHSSSGCIKKWSSRRISKSWPSPYQEDALPLSYSTYLVFLFVCTAGTPKQRSYPNIRFRKLVHPAGLEPAQAVRPLVKSQLLCHSSSGCIKIGRWRRNRTHIFRFGDEGPTIRRATYKIVSS